MAQPFVDIHSRAPHGLPGYSLFRGAPSSGAVRFRQWRLLSRERRWQAKLRTRWPNSNGSEACVPPRSCCRCHRTCMGRTTTSAQRASDTADGRTKLRRWIDESPFAPDRTTLHLKPKHNSLDRECERVHTVCLVLAAQHGVVPSAHCHPQQVCSLAGRREHGRSIPFADLVQCQLLYRLLGVKQTRYAQREFFRV